MYYYGYNGGYPANYGYGYPGGSNFGYGAAIILVLFILLVIIFGVGFNNQGCCNQGCNKCCN